MTQDDRARLRRDGLVILKGIVEPSAIADTLAEMRAVFDRLASVRGLPTAEDASLASLTRVMTALFAADMAAYLAAAKLCQHLVALHRMGCDARLIEALKGLGLALPVVSTRPVLFIMADALKVPGGYHKTPPHQDWRSIQGSLDGVVVWVPFAAVGEGAHALEVLPGSHRLGLLASEADVFGHRVHPAALPPPPFEPLSVALGDAVVFSTLLVHRTGELGGPVARIAASFRFNNAAEPSFADRLYPNPYVYRPDMTLLHPGAASAERVAAALDLDGSDSGLPSPSMGEGRGWG